MKWLLLATLCFNSNVWADDKKPNGENFEQHKAKMLENLDKRISSLQESRGCIAAARDRESLKNCHKSMKERMNKIREDAKAYREEMRSGKKEKRQNKK